MADVADLIARLIAAGTPADLVGEVAAALVDKPKVSDVSADTSADKRERDRIRKRNSRARSKSASADSHADGHTSVRGQSADTPFLDKEVSPAPLQENSTKPIPPSPPKGGSVPHGEIDLAIEAYSGMAKRSGLAVPRIVSDVKRAKIASILKTHGMPIWLEAVEKIGASSFCHGDNERGWKADLEFMLQAKSFARILEGHYDQRQPSSRGSPNRRETGPEKLERMQRALAQEIMENGYLENGAGGPAGADNAAMGGVPLLAFADQRRSH